MDEEWGSRCVCVLCLVYPVYEGWRSRSMLCQVCSVYEGRFSRCASTVCLVYAVGEGRGSMSVGMFSLWIMEFEGTSRVLWILQCGWEGEEVQIQCADKLHRLEIWKCRHDVNYSFGRDGRGGGVLGVGGGGTWSIPCLTTQMKECSRMGWFVCWLEMRCMVEWAQWMNDCFLYVCLKKKT